MRGSVSVCLCKGRQIEKTCINFFEESGLNATLSSNVSTDRQNNFKFYFFSYP